MDPQRQDSVQPPTRRPTWTMIALIGGFAVLVLLIVFFFATRNPDQDKLIGNEVTEVQPDSSEKLCSSKATYDLIKRELFRRAAQVRGSDQAAYDQLAAFAVVRMDNAVMESEASATGGVNCSGSLSLDLPPGVAVTGGRRTLTADVDYVVQSGGNAVQLNSGDALIASLATLTRVAAPPATPPEVNDVAPEADVTAPESANIQPGSPSASQGRPSFDCAQARSRGEIAVCEDSGLAELDFNMATQYRRALSAATPEQRAALQRTRNRFLMYRESCRDTHCIAEAYLGRMREIRDIMEARAPPPR